MKHLEEEDVQEIKSCILEVTLSKRFSEHDKRYLFCLVINSQETFFRLKVGDVKRFLLPCHVSYQIIPVRGQAITQYDIKPQKGTVSAKKVRVEIHHSSDISTITTTIRGQIFWEYDDELEVKIPDKVWVGLKDNEGQIISKKIVKKDDYERWMYVFYVPKYNENGETIIYELCQENLEHYETVIMGKNIKNIIYTPVDYVVDVKYIPSKQCLGTKRIQLEYGEDPVSRENLTVDVEREGEYHLGPIQFFKPGVYLYDVVLYEGDCVKDISSILLEVGKNDFDLEIISVEYIQEETSKESHSLVFDCRFMDN